MIKFARGKVLLCLLFFNIGLCFGQSPKHIVDNQTNEGIPYAVVTIDSLSYYSGINGNFNLLEGEEISIHHLGYEKYVSNLPLQGDTIFLQKKLNEIEEVVIGGQGVLFTKGNTVKKTKSFFSNGAINGDVFAYFEIIKGFEFDCSYFRINSLSFYLSDKNKSPYRLNFYNNKKELVDNIIVTTKQKKGNSEVLIDKTFNTHQLYVGFEWLPNADYKTVEAQIDDSKDFVSFTEFSLGGSGSISSEKQYHRKSPTSAFIPFKTKNGLILQLNCECLE